MSNPYTPAPGPNDFVEPNMAKHALIQHLKTVVPENSPQFWTGVQRINDHVDSIVANETQLGLTGRRVGELGLLVNAQLGPTPEQIAQQRAREQGHAADLNELPAAFRADLDRMGGVTEEDVAEFAQAVYSHLPKKEAISKYLEVVKRTAPEGVAAFTRPLADINGRAANVYGQQK